MTTETTPTQADASTAFLRAARAGQIEKIISLLEQGVDINVSNANGLNAIHLASKDGHVEVVRELLHRGAAIDAATKKGNTALHIASLAGQETVVKLLVQSGAQVNIQSQNGFTPLYMAAQENHDTVVKFLLANGANQSLATEDGFTPLAVAMQQGHEKVVAVLLEADTRGRVRLPALHIAAKKDDVKAANLLLENEHNPDVTSKSGFTPLHIAAHYGNESVARLLLAKGADVNCPAKHNICPLHVAAKWGKENMVALLCDNGANVEARTRDGLTPLHCAARSGHERVVEALLDRGAPITSKSKVFESYTECCTKLNVSPREQNGLAPLHMAAQGDHAEAARALLSRRAPVDDVTVDYLTALHVAAHCGHAKVAKLLLDRNADANARALNGFTPLHIACKKNRIKVVELLLKYGASISATTESGLTPLHVAAFMGCMNIVIYLLQHEANPDVPTVRGETPLHLAARANQTDIIRILLRNGAAVEAKARERQTPLHIASRLGNVDIAVLLLQHGADVRALTADHYNPLHIAAKQHNHDVAAALIEHGAPLTSTTKKGFTPLHLAAKYGNLKVTNLLLAHGASPDQAGKNGVTPLHVAAQYDQQAVATTLLEKGADAKAVAKNGHTPLHIAARKNQMEAAATLLEYGALTNAESKAGFTPLHLAAQQGHTEMCSLLLEHGADVNHQAKNGLAALHLAAQEDRVPVAQVLIKNGAEVDICTKGGYTPLHVASHYGQANMVRYLLENGASPKTQTAHGYTALHHAAQQGHINIVNILLEHKADANAVTTNGQTPLDIASKLGYVTVMETLKGVSEPSLNPVTQDKYKVVAPETMYETFMSDSEEEGGEDTVLNDQPYRYLTADDMKSLGDDSLPIDVTRDERAESAMGHKNIMELSQTSMNGPGYPQQEVVVKSISRYSAANAPEGYCYNVDPTQPNFLVSFLVDARGGAMRGCRGGGVRVIVPPLSAQQPTRITCRYLKPSRINHMPPLMEGEALAARVLEMGPVAAKFLGPVILEVPHYASLRGKEREIVILRSDNGSSWREHNTDATDEVLQDILNETLEIEDNNEEPVGNQNPRVTRILTHDFPQYFAVISRIRQEVHAIGPEGGMVSSSVVPQVQAVFPQGALTKKIKVGLQAQIIDSELTAKLLGRGVAVSPVVTVEPRRRKFHKAITLSMPAPRPHTQGMTNQYSTSSAPTLRLLCSISGGTNRAHWEDVTENTPLTFVNDCVSFTTTVSARYWLIDCRHVEDATKMATELYREAIHVPFMARFVVYAKRADQQEAQLRIFCVTDDKEDKALERIERYAQVAKSRDVEIHEGKPCYLEFAGNLVPVTKSGEQLSVPFKAFRENRLAFSVMVKSVHADAVARCQFMREPKVPKGEPTPAPICVLNIVIPEETVEVTVERTATPVVATHAEDQDLIWRQRLSDPRLEDICKLLGKDWVALAYELGVSIATVNQIQAKRITAPEQAQLMLKLWKTQSGVKTQDNSLELALCRIGRDDIIAPQSDVINERRIQRNIYQERQASEEIEAYKAEEDNKLKEKLYEDNKMKESIPNETELQDHDEAKYSPEEKSLPEKTEQDRTPSPSEESEDEDVKRSVAERKEQITRKLSSSKIPASKQKKEIREEIIEIKTQIKPDIKKFHGIEQQVKEKVQGKLERSRSKSSPESADEEKDFDHKFDETKIIEKTTEVLRKYDPSSPTKPTPKHLQRHMRNESMRFPSGDFSNVTITPRKSIPNDISDAKQPEKLVESALVKEIISQKEIVSSQVEEKLEDGEKSPELVMDDVKDIAEAPLKDKISSFESRILKEPSLDLPKITVKLTKEALMKHAQDQQDHDQGLEYTQEFVRDQSKQICSTQTVEIKKTFISEIEKQSEVVKTVKETIQHFDTKMKQDDKVPKTFPKTTRTDSTLVQVSSEEDSEFLKKSTDSETETESQTTIKAEKEAITQKYVKVQEIKHRHVEEKEVLKKQIKGDSVEIPTLKTEKLQEVLEEKLHEVSIPSDKVIETVDKVSLPGIMTESVKTKIEVMTTGESPAVSIIDTADSLVDLQQSTEKDLSFISHTDSKVYSKDSKQRSDSVDETSQFSDLEDQTGASPAHKPVKEPKEVIDKNIIMRPSDAATRDRTLEFLHYECEYSARIHSPVHVVHEVEKVSPKESPVISAKARQFIETVPEDDSVQECFFSKRIYSDSLEDSEHTDSRRHSEAESLKSDQSDVKAKVSSSDFDERAEYEETVDSGSGFGDEKFEESVGFTSLKLDMTAVDLEKAESDKSEDQVEVIFKKMTPKRHSRTESISITKLSDIQPETEEQTTKQEFQMFVTEAEEIITSFEKDEPSDKISSESSREIEISERKSSEGVSDKISSEDGVTEKKTSSEEDAVKVKEGQVLTEKEKDTKITASIEESVREIQKTEKKIQMLRDEIADKAGDIVKRQSVTSAGSGSELRLDEKRLSDAHSLTESRDYTFEESEDDIGTQGDGTRERADTKLDLEYKAKFATGKIVDASKHRLTHGDSLDDVEGFPEDHVTDHVHKLPYIAEVGLQSESGRDITLAFLTNEREAQLKRENISTDVTKKITKPLKEVPSSPVMKYTEESIELETTSPKEIPEKIKPEYEIKAKTMTVSQLEFDISSKGEHAAVQNTIDLKKATEVNEEQVKNVIDEIIEKGTIVAAARSPIIEKDISMITKDIIESEKRSYDVKAVGREERRHSSISPAISLERIAESDVESEEDISKFPSECGLGVLKFEDSKDIQIKKSDSAMKQMADNIEIIIKQASEEIDLSGEEPIETQEEIEKGSIDSKIEKTYTTIEEHPEVDKEEIFEDSTDILIHETKAPTKERPLLMKSLSRDSGEIAILPKKKQPRTFSVQSSPEEVEEQIYTDSESDMDKAKVLEIIEPVSDEEGKLPESSFDTRKIRTDSLDDADELFPERDTDYFVDDTQYLKDLPETSLRHKESKTFTQESTPLDVGSPSRDSGVFKVTKRTFVDKIVSSDIISKSTTESSVTTVISTLTKSSEEDQKSVLDEATSADFSKISGADLVKDSSKASVEPKDISKIEEGVIDDRGTPDISKKSIDLTKDYSKSSIDSKDTSRDFTTNELSKDSTVDLTKDFSKASVESVKDASKSFEEKTYSEDQSSLDISKTLASDVSEALTISKEYVEIIDSDAKITKVFGASSAEISVLADSKVITTAEEKSKTASTELKATKPDSHEGSLEKRIDSVDEAPLKSAISKDDASQTRETGLFRKHEDVETETKKVEKEETAKAPKVDKVEEEPSDISELNRRCSTLLEDISQAALIRIDSSHVTHDLSLKFSKTPPPSPVDLTARDKSRAEDGASDKQIGLQPRGSDSSFLDANRQSPRASSAGDSLISETEAHQSEILREASKVLTAAATPKSPTRHLADNITFINVSQPTITSGAIDLVDSTIEKSIDVIDQIKKEQFAVKTEGNEKKTTMEPEVTLDSKRLIYVQPVQKSVGDFKESQLKFQSIDPDTVVSNMIAKYGTTEEFSTILSHKETETRKISGQEYFSETKQVSSSDDDSLIIKTETTHELRGQEHKLKEKSFMLKDGTQTETSQKIIEKAQEASSKRSDVETKTVFKSTDDTSIIKVQREFLEQGLYTGRQTKSEEKMTALKDDTVKKEHEIKYSERDLSHEQWGKEYFTEPCELEDIEELDDSMSKKAFIDSTFKTVEKDESLSNSQVSEKGKIISSKTEHHKEESVIESKEHIDLSSDVSHEASFKSETAEKHESTESSPKTKSKSFNKDNEVYEVDFIKEIKVSTSPVKSTFSRTGSQETHSESEAVPDLPHDDKPGKDKETGIETEKIKQRDMLTKSPIKIPQQQVEDQVWEISLKEPGSMEAQEDSFKIIKPKAFVEKFSSTKNSEIDSTQDSKHITSLKFNKSDYSPSTVDTIEDLSTTSKDIMIKSAESADTECMVKSLESHEGEVLQKSIDSTMSAETLQPSEFSTEADSAFLTGTDHKKDELKLTKEKSLEDICSSGYDTDLSSAEFHAPKFETERVDYDSFISTQPLADLSVLEKTIDEVKQSLEAAQVEILSEKSDGSSKYKQSPSEFQFKLLISPERPEVITEESHPAEDINAIRKSDAKHVSEMTVSNGTSQTGSSQEEQSFSEEDKDTVHQKESSPGPADVSDLSCRSDSGPHSILETESELILSEKDSSSKGSPEVKLRAQKHIKTKLGVTERRSASDLEGWSSSGGSSHYQSFDHSDSRPLSSDMEGMMTAQSGTDFDTALTTQDISSRSLRTSRDYYTAASSLASRDSMKSLDSDGSSHLASIDISDASETLVPSANELKEELMESSTYVEQFLHEGEKGTITKAKDASSDDEIFEEEKKVLEPEEIVSKMKRSHEMRFQPKDMIPEQFPLESLSEGIDNENYISIPQFDKLLTAETDRKVLTDKTKPSPDTERLKENIVEETITVTTTTDDEAIPFKITKLPKSPHREFVDIESQIIPLGSEEYEEIVKSGSSSPVPRKPKKEEDFIKKAIDKLDELIPPPTTEVKEECVKKIVEDIMVVPFPVTKLTPSQREFVDVESDIIPVGSKQYEEIMKSKSDSSVPKTKTEKSVAKVSDSCLVDSKQSSFSSLKTHEHLSTPQTPLSAPSQSSISTENGREYVLDDMYDIPETPELRSEIITEGTSSRSELIVTTEEKTLHQYDKEQESPTSDEFEIVDKPNEMDDFVVIEEVAKEAQETDTEGKSIQISQQKYVRRHDTEVEEYLTKASKKQDSEYSTSGSLSDEEMLQYEQEQKRLKALELAEIEAGKKWIQMQFEGDPRYEYERVPLEDIKEEEMTDFDASRIGSLSSQKESIGSYGSFRNSYGSLSESEMASRLRFRVRGENDDISISSLQEFENLEKALMEQYQQHSSSSQDSLNGSLPRRYFLSKSSQGDDVSISSLKEFEGLESACIEALKAEIAAKQKEALLLSDPKVLAGGFLEHERRSYSGGSSESSPPQKGSSPSQKSGSPSQKSGSPSQKSGSPLQKVGSYGSPSQKMLTDSLAIRKIIDQQIAVDQKPSTVIVTPKIVTVKKFDDRGAYFVEDYAETSVTKPVEITETCKKTSAFVCAAAPSDGSAESLPGDCEEMMKILEEEAQKKKFKPIVTKTFTDGGVIEVVRTTTVIQQRFVDGKKVSETVTSTEGDKGVDIPGAKRKDLDNDVIKSFGSEISTSQTSQQSDMDSLITVLDRPHELDSSVTVTRQTIVLSSEKPEDLDFSRSETTIRELSPSSGKSVTHSTVSVSGKHFTDPASGSWSGQDEDLSSSGSLSRNARADLMLGSTDSLEATSSNATRATYNYEIDTPMTGSLTSGGSNTMVSSLDTLDPLTAVHLESLEHPSTSEHFTHDYEVHEPDSDPERLELDGKAPRAKERTIMFDSTDTLSAVSGDSSVKEGAVETPAPTFYIGDTPIVRGERREETQDVEGQVLSGSCPASLPPTTHSSPPVPAQRRSLTMIARSPPSSIDEELTKK